VIAELLIRLNDTFRFFRSLPERDELRRFSRPFVIFSSVHLSRRRQAANLNLIQVTDLKLSAVSAALINGPIIDKHQICGFQHN
jgi:hypothetical protein